MSAKRLGLFGLLLLVLAAAVYWLLPAYVLPPMDISQRPTEQSEPIPATAPVTSYVSIPLSFSIESIKRLVREQLSGKLLADNVRVPGRNLQVSVQRNGTQALWVRDADMHMVLPLKFRTQGDLKTKGELTIFTRASFNVSEDWEPLVDARSTFRWDWQPRVGVWPFRFRIGKVLSPYIQLALDKGSIDFRKRASDLYNLRSIAEAAWARLHGPYALDEQSQTWLAMQPRELYLEPITSDKSDVRLNIWMAGEMGIAQGEQPAAVEATPLPKLRHGEPPAKSIALTAPVTVSYERMLTSLREAMIGKTLPSSSGELTLTELDLYSAGTDVVLGIRFEGNRTGSLLPTRGYVYLSGQPHYDAATRTLSIRNLAITEPGVNPLAHGARWVLQQAPTWIAVLEPRLNWDAGPLLDEHQQKMDGYLNKTIRSRFDLWGEVEEMTVTAALPQAQGVMLQTQVRGDLELLFVP